MHFWKSKYSGHLKRGFNSCGNKIHMINFLLYLNETGVIDRKQKIVAKDLVWQYMISSIMTQPFIIKK